jgi:hypothetical protein
MHVHGGRGVSYAGWGEELVADDSGRRQSWYGAAGIRRLSERLPLGFTAYAKRVEERGSATAEFFPELGFGPRGVAGALADAGLRGARGRLHWGLDAQLAWTPSVDGERSGLAEGQVRFLGRCAFVDLFDGDLSITLRARWRLESQRPFREGVELAPFSAGDARLDFRLLQRLLFYWDVQNVADTTYEVHPGVHFPGRTSMIGVRATLID